MLRYDSARESELIYWCKSILIYNVGSAMVKFYQRRLTMIFSSMYKISLRGAIKTIFGPIKVLVKANIFRNMEGENVIYISVMLNNKKLFILLNIIPYCSVTRVCTHILLTCTNKKTFNTFNTVAIICIKSHSNTLSTANIMLFTPTAS